MSEPVPTGHDGDLAAEALALTVGCTFGLESVQPAEAIMQVAPFLEAGLSVAGERWDTSADHHAYVDQVMTLVMPSRLCLPDELGHEAWRRFGGLAPGAEPAAAEAA
jgi:hypothetical protein